MPTKRPKERYLGQELRIPISEDGQVAAYVWHWHGGLYDPEHPNASQKEFPAGLTEVPEQVAWAFGKIREDAAELVRAAAYTEEAEGVQPGMVAAAVEALSAHLAGQGDLRGKAIAENLIQG